MGVGAADAEGGDTRTANAALALPLTVLGEQRDGTGGPVDVRRRLIDMQRVRQDAMAQGHHHLDHTRHTRRRLRVPQIRLHRPQPQRPLLRPILTVGRQQRLRLDRITQRRTGTVRLHHIHLRSRQTRTRQRLPDHPLLRRTIRRRQTIRRTVLIHRRTPHHRQHLMPTTPRIRQPLHQQHPHTLGPPRTIRRRRERLAPTVRRQPLLPTELRKDPRRRHHRHTTGQRHRTLTTTQRLSSKMQGNQRRRTRRIHRHRRTLKAERVGDTAGGDAGRAARQQVTLHLIAGGERRGSGAVVRGGGADEHTDLVTPQRQRRDTRTLQHLPRRLQQQPLLRIHRQRLTRRNTEQPRIEPTDPVKEPTLTRRRRPRPTRIRIKQPLQIPTTIRRGTHPPHHHPKPPTATNPPATTPHPGTDTPYRQSQSGRRRPGSGSRTGTGSAVSIRRGRPQVPHETRGFG